MRLMQHVVVPGASDSFSQQTRSTYQATSTSTTLAVSFITDHSASIAQNAGVCARFFTATMSVVPSACCRNTLQFFSTKHALGEVL